MNYNLKGTNVAITDEIRRYVEKGLNTLDKLVKSEGKPRVDVELEYKEGEAKMYRAELMLHAPGTTEPLRAEAERGTLHEAMDAAASELLHELTKTKKKRMRVFRHSAVRVKEYLRGWRDKF
ncbi:MAG: ribosome-associated translation inhibitor RaiA [Candidatus Adlerbacteria bacterium]